MNIGFDVTVQEERPAGVARRNQTRQLARHVRALAAQMDRTGQDPLVLDHESASLTPIHAVMARDQTLGIEPGAQVLQEGRI